MKTKELAEELNKWFINVNINQNFWNENPVAKVIKDNLEKIGNFKYRQRGNPRKAYRKMQFILAKRNGYDGEFEE